MLLNLRSRDVEEVASLKRGNPQFMIGFVSKQFFAAALLKALYEKRAVGVSEEEKAASVKKLLQLPLSHFFPENADLWDGAMPGWARIISLHHLLSHTSGLPDYLHCEEYEAETHSGKKLCETPGSIKEILKIISNYPLEFEPGSKYSYSNTGYGLIARVIETISGMSAACYVKEALFCPLGLTSTSNPETGVECALREQDPSCSQLVPQGAYDPTGDQTVLQPPSLVEDMSWAQGDGSIISTAVDLLKWNIALHHDRVVLSRPLYTLLITENLHGYAYGLVRSKFYGGTLLSHTGGIGTYRTFLGYLPEHKISIFKFSHISLESVRIEREFKQLMEELKDKITGQRECANAVGKILRDRYPDKRSFPANQALDHFFDDSQLQPKE